MKLISWCKQHFHKSIEKAPKLPVPKKNDIFILHNKKDNFYYIAQIVNDVPFTNAQAHEIYECRLYKITMMSNSKSKWYVCSFISPDTHEFSPSLPGLFMEKHVMLDKFDSVYYYGKAMENLDFFNSLVKDTYKTYYNVFN